MKRWSLLCVPAMLAAMFLPACGGSDASVTPPVETGGRIQGNLGTDAAGATVRLDGTDLTATAGADGSFVLKNVPPGEYTLSIEGGGGRGAATMCRVADGRVTTVPAVEMNVGGQISGLVYSVSRQDAPIAGARVTIRRIDEVWAYEDTADPGIVDQIEESGGSASREVDTTVIYPPRTVTTDDDGSYRVTGLPEGPYVVEVEADGYEKGASGTWVSPGSTSPVDVWLVYIDPDNATLSGRVTTTVDGGTEPLAYVSVSLWPADNETAVARCEECGDDSEGDDSEGDDSEGDDSEGDDSEGDDSEGDDEGGGDDVAEVTGDGEGGDDTADDLYDANGWADGEPPSDVDPWCMPPWYIGYQTSTDENGDYTIANIVPGTYVLTIWRYGYEAVSEEITLDTQQAATFSRTLASILTTISGTIYGRRGDGGTEPLVGAWVSGFRYVWGPVADVDDDGAEDVGLGSGGSGGAADYSPDGLGGTVETGPDGSYTIEVEAGYVALSVWADGYQAGWTDFEVPEAGATGVDLILEPWDDDTNGVPVPFERED